MASLSSIAEKVRRVIADELGIDEDEVTLDATLIDDLGVDDLGRVELIMALESEFDIEVNDPDGDDWVIVKDMIEYFERRVQ